MTVDLARYRANYDKTEVALIRLQGLAHAAYQLAIEHPALNSDDPTAAAIMSILAMIEEKAEAVRDLHEFEWLEVVEPNPATLERGK